MGYVLICQSLFVWINRGDELSVWRIKRSQLYFAHFQCLDQSDSLTSTQMGWDHV